MTTTASGSVAATTTQPGPLFRPGRIGRMTLRNRFVQAPIFTQFASTWGEVGRPAHRVPPGQGPRRRRPHHHREHLGRLGAGPHGREPDADRPRPVPGRSHRPRRGGAQRGREDRRPAAPHRPAELAGQHRAQRAPHRADGRHHERLRHTTARDRGVRDPRAHRPLRAGRTAGRGRRASTRSSCTAPTATCFRSSSRPRPTTAPTTGADRWRTAPGSPSRS